MTGDIMSPEARYEHLATAPAADVESLADLVLSASPQVRVLNGPSVVSAPVRVPVPGTRQTTSVIGHVALTTCSVELAGHRGDGVRSGRDLTGSIAAAVCDAEVERGGPLTAQVLELCRTARSRTFEAAARRSHLVSATRLGDSG